MLKSPTSILNSIQRMKTNLRNDKQQLKKIKNNFVYLDRKQTSEIKQFNFQMKVKQRSKSMLTLQQKSNIHQSKVFNKQNQNDNSPINYLGKSNFGENKNKKQCKYKQKPFYQENILQDLQNRNSFLRNKQKSALIQTSKENQIIKNMKNQHQKQIEKLKQSFQTQKNQLLNKINTEIQKNKLDYQIKIKELLDYVKFLEQQINSQQQKFDQSCQTLDNNKIFSHIESQTENLNIYSPQSIVSKIQSQNEPNMISYHFKDHNLLQLCNINCSENSQDSKCCKQLRHKYQPIINCLLEENRKLHLRIQKVYSSNSIKQNTQKQKCNENWINYGSISSRLVNDSKQFQSSKNGNKYYSNKQSKIKKISQMFGESHGQQSSRVVDKGYYNSNKQSERSKQSSIIYRVSNVMSNSFLKERKDSKTKLTIKNPPCKLVQCEKQTYRIKTQNSNQSNNQNKQNSNSSNYNSSIDSNSRYSKQIQNKLKPQIQDFKFYNEDSINFNKSKLKPAQIISDEQGQILNDEIKLKTIKQFKCFSKN